QHSFAAAEGAVVHGTVKVEGPPPQVVDSDLNQSRCRRAGRYSVLERTAEELGKDCDDVKNHESRSFNPSGRSTRISCAAVSMWRQIDVANGINMSSSSFPSDFSFPSGRTASSGGPPNSFTDRTVPTNSPD